MTIGEAHAVNVLCRWLLGRTDAYDDRPEPTGQQARAALATLADKANKALMAGWEGQEVFARWDAQQPQRPTVPPGGGQR